MSLIKHNGTYLCAYLNSLSSTILKFFLSKQNIYLDISYPLHVTIISSSNFLNLNQYVGKQITVECLEFIKLGQCLVIKVQSNELNKLHQLLVSKGLNHIHPEYIPHITISENFTNLPLDNHIKGLNLIATISSQTSLIL
jgi:hypothetical protein